MHKVLSTASSGHCACGLMHWDRHFSAVLQSLCRLHVLEEGYEQA